MAAKLSTVYRRRLRTAGRLDTAEGQHVMELVRAIETGGHSAAGLASLSKELRLAFAAAVADADREPDMIDELADRRRQRAGEA